MQRDSDSNISWIDPVTVSRMRNLLFRYMRVLLSFDFFRAISFFFFFHFYVMSSVINNFILSSLPYVV